MRPHLVSWLEAVLPGSVASALAPTWFTCVGLAGIVTLFVMLSVARRHRLDPAIVASSVLWCYVAAVAAGIVVPMALDLAEQLFTTGRIHVRWAGMTSFWGYLAGVVAVAAVCRAHHLPLARFGDLAAAPLGLALVLARLGCFVAGCDFGKVTRVPWAVRFPSGSPAWQAHVGAGLVPADRAESLPVHPTQLYEAALGVLIIAVAWWATRRRWAREAHGRVFLVTAAVYAIGRIVIEDFRGDTGRGIYLGLASGQIFSLLVLATIAIGLTLRRVRLATAVATATLVLALTAPDTAHAQPQPQAPSASRRPAPSPQPAPASQPAPAPQPASSAPAPPRPGQPSQPSQPGQPGQSGQPGQPSHPSQPGQSGQPSHPFGPPPQPPAAAPAPPAQPMQPAQPTPYDTPGPATQPSVESSGAFVIHVGGLLGLATPINRRPDQVAMLGGPSLSIGLALRRATLWLDLDSFANTDASHGTALLSGSMMTEVANHLQIGGRIGLGATLVNFKDPAFRDVAGTTVRIDALAEYALGRSWAVWLRPLSFDILSAAALGGPIATWQTRLGIGYRFPIGHRAAPAAQPAAAPAPYPPPQPGAAPQPQPGTAPTPQPAPYQQQPGASPPPQPAPYPPPTTRSR